MAMLVFKSCLGKLVWSGRFVALDLFWKWQNWLCLSWKNFWINFVCCVPVLKCVPMQQGCVWKRWLLVLLLLRVWFPYLHKNYVIWKAGENAMLNPKNWVKYMNVLVLQALMKVDLSQRLSMDSRASLFLGSGGDICLYFHNCKYKNRYISWNV